MVPVDGTEATNELHTHFLADVDTSTRLHSVEKSGSNDEFHLGEFRPQGGFQSRNPNPVFMDFFLYRFI